MAAAQPKSTPLSPLINDFIEHMEIEKNASPLTLRNYRHYLRRFNKWFGTQKHMRDIFDLELKDVRLYRVYLSRFKTPQGKNLSVKTQAYHIIALRAFLKFLIKNDFDVLSPDKIDVPKFKSRSVKFLNGQQVDRFLAAPKIDDVMGLRDKAILEVLFSTGLRVSELTSLDKNRIDFERREMGIIGKGGKARVVFLSSRASLWIKKYLAQRTDAYKPLFIRHSGKMGPDVDEESMRLTDRSVQRMVKKYAKKINLAVDVTPHVLRHSFATDLLVAGADIRSVQEMLGHENIQTTQVYTHVTDKSLKEVHEKFHGKD